MLQTNDIRDYYSCTPLTVRSLAAKQQAAVTSLSDAPLVQLLPLAGFGRSFNGLH